MDADTAQHTLNQVNALPFLYSPPRTRIVTVKAHRAQTGDPKGSGGTPEQPAVYAVELDLSAGRIMGDAIAGLLGVAVRVGHPLSIGQGTARIGPG